MRWKRLRGAVRDGFCDLRKVPEDQAKRFRDAYGEIRHMCLFAKPLDDGRGMFEAVAGHGGEEVVLDLIV